jgi:hydroxymethylbilane synthase
MRISIKIIDPDKPAPASRWAQGCVIPLLDFLIRPARHVPVLSERRCRCCKRAFQSFSMNSETHSAPLPASSLATKSATTPTASPLAPPATLVIATRESRLALWQAEHVQAALQKLYPACQVSLLGMTTRGDQIQDRTLAKVGGKGLFVKELETALEQGRADLAVHSLKDVPMTLPVGFTLAAVMQREDPRDALVSSLYASLDALPPGSVVGTSSLRREAMVRARYPHLHVAPLRGNLDTRLAKLDRGDYAAIILAAAGLQRLGLAGRIRARLDVVDSLPAAGQGALGIETRADRPDLLQWLAPLADRDTALATAAERAVSLALGGSCTVPLAAYGSWDGAQLRLQSSIATPDGARTLRADACAAVTDLSQARQLGQQVAQTLIDQGALGIVQDLSDTQAASVDPAAPTDSADPGDSL